MSESREPEARPLRPHEIQRDALMKVKEGDRLCEIGRGTDNLIHRHITVTGVTKLYIKVDKRNHISEWVDRFRRDSGRSVPYSEYGGSHVYTTCQQPKKKDPS